MGKVKTTIIIVATAVLSFCIGHYTSASNKEVSNAKAIAAEAMSQLKTVLGERDKARTDATYWKTLAEERERSIGECDRERQRLAALPRVNNGKVKFK